MATLTWTATILHQDRTERGKKYNTVALQATSGTYLAGGIAPSAGACGLPAGNIENLAIIDNNGDGYIYQWNRASGKIQIFETIGTSAYAAHALVEMTSAVSPSSAITIEVKGY